MTDGKIGAGQAIKQSLLIIVEVYNSTKHLPFFVVVSVLCRGNVCLNMDIILLIGGMETNNNYFVKKKRKTKQKDVNDNRPVFQPFANTLMLRENAPPAVILTVEATDRDQGVYGQVPYSLLRRLLPPTPPVRCQLSFLLFVSHC